VELRCTCGAVLPEDARFCHKCGKPQYEEDIQRIEAQEAAPPTPVQSRIEPPLEPRLGGISFHDGRAVLVTMVAAVLAFFGVMIASKVLPAEAPALSAVVLLVAGFLVPAAYRSPTRANLSAAAGARLGWMLGVWLFLGFMILIALFLLAMASPEGGELLKQFKNNPQLSQMHVMTPQQVITGVAMMALPLFLLLTVLPGLGGMLGARFWSGRRS
jgi:hypothetical protein